MSSTTKTRDGSPGREPSRASRRAAVSGVLRLGAAITASGALAGALALAAMPAQASVQSPSTHSAGVPNASAHYSFRTLNSQNDPTFNQLLGINSNHKIVGYFGSGAKGHPNKGYALHPPYRQVDYRNQNFPHSRQTQVTGLNNIGVTVGFWSTQNKASLSDNNFGYYAINGGHFHKVNFPTHSNSSPPVNQLLGVNDHDVAVGFYVNASGNSRGYTYNIRTHHFARVLVGGSTAVTATAINDSGSIAGFFTNSHGVTNGFFRRHTGQLFVLRFPGATMTQAFGANLSGEVVGAYTKGSGASATTYGFTWNRHTGFRTVNDPHGIGSTIINGVNNAGDLVGFYTGKNGNTDGMLATPR